MTTPRGDVTLVGGAKPHGSHLSRTSVPNQDQAVSEDPLRLLPSVPGDSGGRIVESSQTSIPREITVSVPIGRTTPQAAVSPRAACTTGVISIGTPVSSRKTIIIGARVYASGCLLYTSDAADEEDSVDLGGRRIIKN